MALVGLVGFFFALAGPNGMIAYNVLAAMVIISSLVVTTIQILRLQ